MKSFITLEEAIEILNENVKQWKLKKLTYDAIIKFSRRYIFI